MDGNPMMMFGAAGAAASYFMLLNATVFLATQERDRRRSNIGFGLHFGPGVYDDYEFLFSEEGRAGYSDDALAAFDRQFQKIFRLDVKSYEYVSSRLHGRLTRRRRGRGNPGVDHKYIMASALLHLATADTYASVARQIRNGISPSTVERAVRTFTRAVVARFGDAHVHFPKTMAGLRRNAAAFERRSKIPFIIGAIDGSHIRIPPPHRHEKSYYNRKHFHSVILQAVVDPIGRFMAVDCGFPGRMADPKIL